MNILVTGGNGQLGCSLKKVSAECTGHNLTFVDLPELDITDERELENIIEKTNCDAVVNCAAYTAVDKAESEPDKADLVNNVAAGIIAKHCKKNNIPLIHISTDYVFDGKGNSPLVESDPTNPQGVYGSTKLKGENAVQESGCNAAIIRTSWLYSEFGNNFVKTMLRLGKERDSISVVNDQKGSPTYAVDLARAIIKIAESKPEGYQIYHYSNEGEITWYEFAKEIFMMAGIAVAVLPVSTEEYPTAAKRPKYSVMSKNKIKSLGVYVPNWKESLKICIDTLKKGNN